MLTTYYRRLLKTGDRRGSSLVERDNIELWGHMPELLIQLLEVL
jgi:hypothetical protein